MQTVQSRVGSKAKHKSSAISDYLNIPKTERNLAWIKGALQIGIDLEHSTIPLYLAAMFSIETQNYTAYNLLRSIVMEEMVHMAIACNILAAIGGTPQIKNFRHSYTGQGLPGGIEPDLQVVLAKLSPQQLKNFLRVEMPIFLLPDEYKNEIYPTISNLYNALKEAIAGNGDEVRALIKKGGTSNQIGDDIGFTTIKYVENQDPLEQLYSGINEIIEQGEGLSSRTLHAGPASEGEASHYCKFAEIYYGKLYQEPAINIELNRSTESKFFEGYHVPFPTVVNTLMVPKDGYAEILKHDKLNNATEVEKQLRAFDEAYTNILNDLEAMWNGPPDKSWPTFGDSVKTMGELRVLSCFYIMKYRIAPELIARLSVLYPNEYKDMAIYTNLEEPVFYGPRFFNLNILENGHKS